MTEIMKNISKNELEMLKNILIGKPSIQAKELLNFKGQENCSNLVIADFNINQNNWNDLAEELVELYLSLAKFKTLQPLEEKVKKRNAKLGFPIKRKRILPDIIKSQILKKEAKKNKLLKKESIKKGLIDIKKKESESLLNKYSEMPIFELAHKLEISESTIKNVLKNKNIDKKLDDKLSRNEIIILKEYFNKRLKIIKGKKSQERRINSKKNKKVKKGQSSKNNGKTVYDKIKKYGIGKVILIAKK